MGEEKAELRPLSIKNYVLYNIVTSQFFMSSKDSFGFNKYNSIFSRLIFNIEGHFYRKGEKEYDKN